MKEDFELPPTQSSIKSEQDLSIVTTAKLLKRAPLRCNICKLAYLNPEDALDHMGWFFCAMCLKPGTVTDEFTEQHREARVCVLTMHGADKWSTFHPEL